MPSLLVQIERLPLLAAVVLAGASYPAIPADLTTPVQQRIAINGANGERRFLTAVILVPLLTYRLTQPFQLDGTPTRFSANLVFSMAFPALL